MPDFLTSFSIGLKHLWNISAYMDILFLIVLSAPYEFKAWKKLLILVSLFTAGHTLALLLSVFNVISVKANTISLIIPVFVLIAALFNIISASKLGKKDRITFIAILTSLLGVLHGLGFSSYFFDVVPGKPTDRLLPLFESCLGFGIGLVIALILALVLAYVVETLLKFSKRDWVLIISGLAVGIVLPMILRYIM